MEFAKIENNKVVNIIVVNESDCLDNNGVFDETIGAAFCSSLEEGRWIQSGYEGHPRKHIAVIGATYDETRDGYIHEKLFDSWVLNEDTCKWESPVPYPSDGDDYEWNEETINWVRAF